MKPADRAKLTAALRDHVARVAEDLRAQMRESGPVRQRARKLHADEQVGEDFDVWTDLLARRGAVLWVLKSVYVRVLEDRGLLAPGRILDMEAQQLFERLAPNLGETAFLRWVYRDLASPRGGLPELFSPQPAEITWPSDALSRELLAFWRHRDPDTGAQWSFAEETFEGELMGDLYQELDPVVKDRFALCQTPDFVRAFILDRTLTPAIETFGAETVRLLDPSCGSGHFLIDGLKRLVAATAEKQPTWDRRKVVEHCLERVVGIDLNDYACALARARLVMTAGELAGVKTLGEAARFHPHVYWADGLEQVEKGKDTQGHQLDLLEPSRNEAPRASLTRPEVRAALGRILEPKFHAVVANPPYITEGDEARKEYHREKVGRQRRYVSAHKLYHLSSPFIERCFQLAVGAGHIGVISDNQFMRRDFGRPLIEKVLARRDLFLVADTSQASIPHHGTPTIMLFARNDAPAGDTVRVVAGKRREVPTPKDPRRGQVWCSLEQHWGEAGFEDRFVRVSDVARAELQKHPWGFGGANQLRRLLDEASSAQLKDFVSDSGSVVLTRADDVYLAEPESLSARFSPTEVRPFVSGKLIRDWVWEADLDIVWPYPEADEDGGLSPAIERWLAPYKQLLMGRVAFGKTQIERGLQWYEYSMLFDKRLPPQIAFSNVTTHNHFALVESDVLLGSHAPCIQLKTGMDRESELALLAYLNSSFVCLWMKQVFHPKTHASQRHHPDPSRAVYEIGTRGLGQLPVPRFGSNQPRLAALANLLSGAANKLRTLVAASGLHDAVLASTTAQELAQRIAGRWQSADFIREQMVAWQEEVDWLVYECVGLAGDDCLVPPARYETLTCPRGDRPFERRKPRVSAVRARQRAVPLELAEVAPVGTLPDWAAIVWQRRVDAIESADELQVLETPVFKRAWRDTDKNVPEPYYRAEKDRQDLEGWLVRHIEDRARSRVRGFTLGHLVADLQDDAAVQRVIEVLSGRQDFSIDPVVAHLLDKQSVPSHATHLYTADGLAKRAAWDAARSEAEGRSDAGEKNGTLELPEFSQGSRGKSTDFLRTDYWRLRGKLDVPKERFVVFTEVPGRVGLDTLYGWAGWTPLQRLKVILAIDEELEDDGVPLADRIGLLDSAWRLLPDVAREDATAASRLKAELQALVGTDGPSHELIEEWKKHFPPPHSRAARRQLVKAKAKESFDDLPSIIPNVSDGEHAAILIWALLHASDGMATRMDLARAFALRARPALLKRLAPASLKREVAHWVTTVGRRSVEAGLLASTLAGLHERNAISLGVNRDSRATVSTSAHTPAEAQIDAWFRFEASLALKVLRAQSEDGFSSIDKSLKGADRKLLEAAA